MPMQKQFTTSLSMPADDIRRAVRENAARHLPSIKLSPPIFGSISVCGNGPSLRDEYPHFGPVAALNGAWRALKKTPDFIIAYDPAPENVAWFKDAPRDATYLLGSRMDPACFDLLRHHKVFVWHLNDAPEKELGLTPNIGGGATIGSHALNVLAAMGYNHFDLYGYDSCFSMDGRHHATEQEWAERVPRPFQVGERMFIAAGWMASQVEYLLEQIPANRHDYTVRVMGDGFLAAAVEYNTLHVVYDLNEAPGSYDFMHSMINIENYRDEQDQCQVKVHFKAGSDHGFRPNELIKVSHEGKTRMLNNVVRPMLKLFGFEEVETPSPLSMVFPYSPAQSLHQYRLTGWMPEFQASHAARVWAYQKYGNTKPVVITLREADHWPQRNSDVHEWVRFARTLPSDQRVVFVRDTDMIGKSFEFETCDEASLDLHKRLALYRSASMNFFVMNGPASLAYYTGDIPYAVFITSAPGYPCYSPIFLQRFLGIDPYGQFPWANLGKQRLIYGDDDLELISKTYKELTK